MGVGFKTMRRKEDTYKVNFVCKFWRKNTKPPPGSLWSTYKYFFHSLPMTEWVGMSHSGTFFGGFFRLFAWCINCTLVIQMDSGQHAWNVNKPLKTGPCIRQYYYHGMEQQLALSSLLWFHNKLRQFQIVPPCTQHNLREGKIIVKPHLGFHGAFNPLFVMYGKALLYIVHHHLHHVLFHSINEGWKCE
jgi:hypothetical protein